MSQRPRGTKRKFHLSILLADSKGTFVSVLGREKYNLPQTAERKLFQVMDLLESHTGWVLDDKGRSWVVVSHGAAGLKAEGNPDVCYDWWHDEPEPPEVEEYD